MWTVCRIPIYFTQRGCTWVEKRIKRTANRLFLGSEHRGFQIINSVKNKPKFFYLFLSIFISFFPYKKRFFSREIYSQIGLHSLVVCEILTPTSLCWCTGLIVGGGGGRNFRTFIVVLCSDMATSFQMIYNVCISNTTYQSIIIIPRVDPVLA